MSTRCIATSSAMLRRLQKIDFKGRYEINIVSDGKVWDIDGQPYYANEVQGKGLFTFSRETIGSVCKCLASFTERPIVIQLNESTFSLQQINF